MKTIEVVAVALQFVVAFMMLRSCFYIIRVRKEMDSFIYYSSLIVLIMGTCLALFNVTEPVYVLQRFPFNSIISIASAYAFYLLTKSKKEDLYTIGNIIKREYTAEEKRLMEAVNNKNKEVVKVVSWEMLEAMDFNKVLEPSKKTQFKKMIPPKGVRFKFDAQLLKGGEFGKQRHPGLLEYIYIDFGLIKDLSTGKTYAQGDVMVVKENTEHNPIALERSGLSAYLYEN